MKKQIIFSAIVFLMGTSILSATPIFYQQQGTVKQDNKDIRQDRDQLAKNRAQRNRDIKKGDPKKAENKQKQVNHDKVDVHNDIKARNQAAGK